MNTTGLYTKFRASGQYVTLTDRRRDIQLACGSHSHALKVVAALNTRLDAGETPEVAARKGAPGATLEWIDDMPPGYFD